jgi:hypothetical protein
MNIKVTTIHMVQHSPFTDVAEALERFNEYMRAEFLEWHISLLKRRMEKMEIEKEAQDLKAAEARSTCEECEEYDHVQGKPRFNASSSIQDWFLFVHNGRTSWTSKLRSTRMPSLSSRLWRKYWRI